MKRDYSETVRARRYVARCAATLLDNGSENDFLYQDEEDPTVGVPETTVRRRKKAFERLVRLLMKQGGA
ncbi:MAG: hypothetical protein ACRCSL_16685 [Microbacterium sp.]